MEQELIASREMFDQKANIKYSYTAKPGLTEEVVRKISEDKGEPEWMLQKRLKALGIFHKLSMPAWGPDISKLDLSEIIYYANPDSIKNANKWENLPPEIKNTFEKLGIPEAEKTHFAGAGAQMESLSVYHNLKKQWEEKGVLFLDMDDAVAKYPDLVKPYFMTQCVSPSLHKFAALHGAVWSGGTFLYVPENVKVDLPLQAYFRMNAEKMGQFEHTLMIVEKGAQASYIEGCSAPLYSQNSLHAGCVEIFVKEGARFRYSSVENWSKNTYNLNTKRAVADKNSIMEWIGSNVGSGVTMLYPCTVLRGENSSADHLAMAFANSAQNQDTGAKVYHLAPNTSSTIRSKSISVGSGVTSYRGLVHIAKGAVGSKSSVSCDALLKDAESKSYTIPCMKISEEKADVAHEATVGKISAEQIFYLMSRGISEQQATQMIVSGFIEPIVKELPLEYAVEMNRLIQLEMAGCVG